VGVRKNEVAICSGCGAEVRFGPASCPLCGKFVGNPPPAQTKKRKVGASVESYQEDLRKLREELDKLRKEIA
jgi:predicted amidophosphoribosyltransferase